MKTIISLIIGLVIWPTQSGDDRPTIDSLIGQEIKIETGWTGAAFTLLKADGKYTVLWEDFGSGVAVIRREEIEVHVRSEYQFLFHLKNGTKINTIVVSLKDRGDFKVYLDGFRIYAEK